MTSKKPKIHLASGAFFYPFITVHDTKKELEKIPAKHKRKISLVHDLPNFKILVTDDGLICPISKNKKEVVEFLNIVFATGVINNIISMPVEEPDICVVKWEEGSEVIEIDDFMIPSVRNHLSLERDNPATSYLLKRFDRALVKPKRLRKLLDISYKYSCKSEFRENLLLFGEGWSFFYEKYSTAAFLYGWMLIETFVGEIWNKYVNSLERSNQEKSNLEDSRNWSTYNHVEVFSLIGRINPQTRHALNWLRQRRNKIVHDRSAATKDEAWNCLNTASKILENQLNDNDPFLDVVLEPDDKVPTSK